MKVTPFNAPSLRASLRNGRHDHPRRPDPAHDCLPDGYAANPIVGSTFDVTASVSTPSYVASGVQVEPTLIPLGVTLLDVQTRRFDGVTMHFLDATER